VQRCLPCWQGRRSCKGGAGQRCCCSCSATAAAPACHCAHAASWHVAPAKGEDEGVHKQASGAAAHAPHHGSPQGRAHHIPNLVHPLCSSCCCSCAATPAIAMPCRPQARPRKQGQGLPKVGAHKAAPQPHSAPLVLLLSPAAVLQGVDEQGVGVPGSAQVRVHAVPHWLAGAQARAQASWQQGGAGSSSSSSGSSGSSGCGGGSSSCSCSRGLRVLGSVAAGCSGSS
jgi:hypothetical protein